MDGANIQRIHDLLDEVELSLINEETEQPEAEEIWIKLKKIEMSLRASIKPITINTEEENVHQPQSRSSRGLD